MKNKILSFDLEEIEDTYLDSNGIEQEFNYKVQDYFSKNINIVDIIVTLQDYLQIYQCTDSDKFERISDELYGTTDYWDILVLLNERNVFFDMSFDSNTIYDSSNKFSAIYFYLTGLNDPTRKTALENEWYEDINELNEKYRILLVPKPHLINDVIKILKTNNYI